MERWHRASSARHNSDFHHGTSLWRAIRASRQVFLERGRGAQDTERRGAGKRLERDSILLVDGAAPTETANSNTAADTHSFTLSAQFPGVTPCVCTD